MARLLHALAVVCRIGYGSVQIRVVKGLPRFIEIHLEEDYSDQSDSKLVSALK